MEDFDALNEFVVTTEVAYVAGRRLDPLFLLVREGRVAWSGSRPPDGLDPEVPVFSCAALIEPLADAHVHLFLTGSHKLEERRAAGALDDDEALSRILTLLEELRKGGVRAVRDGGDPRGLALLAAKTANREPWRYATVAPSGEVLYRRGGYGGFLGAGVGTLGEAEELVKRNAKAGAAQIKVLATGLNSLDRAGEVGEARFSGGELIKICAMAREAGLGVMAHANGPSAPFIEAGIQSLEHGFWMEEGDLSRLAKRNVVWTPTLGAWTGILGVPDLTPHRREVVRATDERQRRAVAEGARLGVRIASGSDAGTPGVLHATGLAGEIASLAEAGLGFEGALRASTVEAMALAASGEAEGLVEGGRAGFVMLDADPSVDYSVLQKPLGVFIGGRLTLNRPLDMRG